MPNKETLLVTGANGLLGSNLCVAAAAAGYEVRAMVRSPPGCALLQRTGITIVKGDVTDRASVMHAAQGSTAMIHTAAVLGGTWSTAKAQDFWNVNYYGAINVMEAARHAGVRRMIDLDTLAIIDWAYTITEHSPIAPIRADDSAYVAAKRAAYFEGMHRTALGQDIVFVTPAGIYGPDRWSSAHCIRRASTARSPWLLRANSLNT